MSCQQASRFHSAAATTTSTATAITTKQAAALAKIATTTVAAAAATKRIATAAATTTTLTPLVGVAGKVTATTTTSTTTPSTTTPPEDLDPYAFTETIAVAPPILFNAQKSRARLNEHSSKSNNSSNNNNNNNNNNKRQTTAGAANRKANLVAQLNATAAAAAAAATTKAQASLATTTPIITTTTNFNNVTQSQSQPRQPPTLSQLQSQSQTTTTSPKRATNVCIVRPQQQEKLTGLGQHHQQQQLTQPQPCLPSVTVLAPPPLYTHTPSLWQTPLILDTNQKLLQHHQQQQQQQQHSAQQQAVIALVSPPTSPASLPSPTLPHNPTAVTAMVAPIVSPKGGGLPPSKFHHNTLAQHLQKVECLKKKKSLPLVCQNNNNMVESLNKPSANGGINNYNLKQPPPLTVFTTGVQQVQAVPISSAPASFPLAGQKAPHSVSTTAPATMTPSNSSSSSMDDSDLNEIPVNVIFRKPPLLMAGAGAGAGAGIGIGNESIGGCGGDLRIVTPLTPPTPPTPPLLANLLPQLTVVSGGIAPALKMNTATPQPQPLPPAAPTSVPAPFPIKTEQKSSKVANGIVAINATPKRQTMQAAGAKNGNNKLNNNNNTPSLAKMSPPPPPLPSVASPILETPAPTIKTETSIRRRRCKPATKRCLTSSENETILSDVPYCLQQHWLHSAASGKELSLEAPLSPSNRREERIAVRKGLLRRQALQLLSTRSLQEVPMRAARQRLQCIQTLLVKYKDHSEQQQPIGIGNRCLVANCKEPTLSMAAHCERHIVKNTTQQLFRPCMAWRMDGTACQAPVFDVLHTLTLCATHSHLRDVARQPPKQVTPPVVKAASMVSVVVADTTVAGGGRKRKTNVNPVNRPQKRARKQPEQVITTLPLVMPSTVLQRKSSTTSLESIASNSQSSGNSQSQLPYIPRHSTTPTSVSASAIINTPAASLSNPNLSIPPALAPLSSDYHQQQQQQNQQQQPMLMPKFEQEEQQLPLIKFEAEQQHLDNSFNLLANANIKAEEISQIVAQLAAADSDLHHHNNNSLHFNHNTNSSSHNNNNSLNYSNNNSISSQGGDSISFPSFNTAFGNAMGGQHTITHNGINRNNNIEQLGDTANLLGQDLFGVCDNSSAYASSEDTGLGGLSESELMGANDADDIALNGAHLLEEHDLVNVFDTLPDDAFNELFQSVQQAECEAMDRALEIADKNLKCLQQTIGGSGDSAFLNDFLDVSDDLLSVMNSPNTSGIDASTIVDNSNSSNGPNNCAPAGTVLDIRGLVQT